MTFHFAISTVHGSGFDSRHNNIWGQWWEEFSSAEPPKVPVSDSEQCPDEKLELHFSQVMILGEQTVKADAVKERASRMLTEMVELTSAVSEPKN